LKGLNYIKGRDDPIALPEEEYPEWLWRCLDVKVKEGEAEGDEGDAFCKLLVHSHFFTSSPNQARESILMETNFHSQVEKAPLEAEEKRQELRAAMRQERRKAIKEKNFLKSM
jgi:large subunit ribosomal protein L54